MEDFTQWIGSVDVTWNPDGFRMIRTAIWASPLLSATVLGLAIITTVCGRSVSLTLASALSGGIAFLPALAGVDHLLTAVAICIQLLMLAGIWRFRRRIARDKSDLGKLAAEMHAVQQRLDEEIRWRTAAESTENIVSTTPPSVKK